MAELSLTGFLARAGGHNGVGIPGVKSIAEHLSWLPGCLPRPIGIPEPALNADGRVELDVGLRSLKQMASHFVPAYRFEEARAGGCQWCAVSLSTLREEWAGIPVE